MADMKEIARAAAMAKAAKVRLDGAFAELIKDCEFRVQQEHIGFEGNEWHKCTREDHPGHATIYPFCEVKSCPFAGGAA